MGRSDKYTDAVFLKCIGDQTPEATKLMKREGIRSVPAFHFWKGGAKIEAFAGAARAHALPGLPPPPACAEAQGHWSARVQRRDARVNHQGERVSRSARRDPLRTQRCTGASEHGGI